ncbi:aryl-sulfate sulfotransferase [Patescibacteria group bacterium]|nr:aryl-sulfate sulfotransferase [Patescibacteria group bacterium]
MLKKFLVVIIVGVLGITAVASAATLAQRLSGSILLQVEENGEAWYVDPVTLLRSYLKDGDVAYSALREFGLGIKNADLNKIPVGVETRFSDTDTDGDGLSDQLEDGLKTDSGKADTDGDSVSDGQEVLVNNTNPLGEGKLVYDTALINRLKGRILLQVESHGESWYLNPKDGKKYYMKDGEAAYQIMRFLSLGITNANLDLIPVNEKFSSEDKTEVAEEDTMIRGTADPDFSLNVYDKTKVMDGTTLFADNHNTAKPRILEVNMLGEIIWEYNLPDDLKSYTNPGFDVERLSNDNILFVCPGSGVYEVNRDKQIVWSYKTTKISHDADRLANGNTIFVFGNNDLMTDPQVVEVNSAGGIVWSWHAKNYFNAEPYLSEQNQGWSHTNAVSRLASGNTLVSPRNFNMVVEVNPQGSVVKTRGSEIMIEQHDPALLENGNLLFANHGVPEKAVEIDQNENVVWEYTVTDPQQWPVRDVNRLSNGNTLIATTTKIIEVTPDKQIVWEFAIKDTSKFVGTVSAGLGFYKAERIVK